MHLPPPLIAVLFIAAMFVLGWLIPAFNFDFAGQRWIAMVLLIAGFMPAALAGKRFFDAKTTILPDRISETSSLVTDGIYQYTRNPMYLGMALVIAAAGIGRGSWLMPLAVAGFVLVINRVQIAPEEVGLEKLFGQDYVAYCQKVRRWI